MKLLQLFEYNFWANDQFITRLKDQPELPEEVTRLFSHILAAHRIWISRIANKPDAPGVWDEIPAEEWEKLNIALYNDTTDVLKSVELDKSITYKNSKGSLYENSVEDLLYHLINHSTHHRSQVALLMRKNEILPPASDYIFYLRR